MAGFLLQNPPQLATSIISRDPKVRAFGYVEFFPTASRFMEPSARLSPGIYRLYFRNLPAACGVSPKETPRRLSPDVMGRAPGRFLQVLQRRDRFVCCGRSAW